MPSTNTHYQTLGVTPTASAGAIRAAYRALARQFHPDVSRAEDAQARFAAIAAAYEVLSDPEKRRDYDQQLLAIASPAHAPSARRPAGHYSWTNVASPKQRVTKNESDFEELWATFFAGRVDIADAASERSAEQVGVRKTASKPPRRASKR